jgi:hypothetical protein
MYRTIPLTGFSRGLNLTDAPNAVGPGEAIDALNVEFTERGAVKQRPGYAQFTGSELTNQPDSLSPFYTTAGGRTLVVGNGNRLDVLDTSGASTANSTAPTANPHYFARFGGPTNEALYIANGTDQVRRLVGTTFSTPAGLSGQTGRFLAVTPTSNRLVVARESGTTAGNNPSSVNFSNAGDPETFTAADYIDLDPGDGEAIMGVIAWREYVFVFKESKFWVHYGESVTSTGGSEFQVRKVKGAGLAASRALCAGPEGVYFMDRQGVWRTKGGEPELISPQIDPFFLGGASLYYKSNTLNHGSITASAMAWHEHRVYLSVPTGTSTTNDRMLVFDPRYSWWTLYDIPASALAGFRISNQAEFVFAAPTGSNYVNRLSSSYTADAMAAGGTGGTATVARWRSGWLDFGSPDVKTIRESELWGSGSVGYRITRDYQDVSGTTDTLVLTSAADTWGDGTGTDTWRDGTGTDLWGPSNTIRPKLNRRSTRGSVFSVLLSNSTLNRTFAVYRIEQRLREQRISSVTETERQAA